MDLRRQRAIAVGCFCVLVLLVGAERRLAEVHLNRLASWPAFENDDLLDGEEIRIRLAAAGAAVQAPDLTGILRVVWRPAPTAPSETVPAPPVHWPSSRSPPSAIL